MIAVAAFSVIVAMMISLWTFRQIQQTTEAKSYINLVIENTNQIFSTLKDAETGQRGYLLTQDAQFLAPYNFAKSHIYADLRELKNLTKNDAAKKHVRSVSLLIEEKMAHLEKIHALGMKYGVDAATDEVRKGEGRLLMSSIHSEMALFNQVEKSAANEIEEKLQFNLRQLFSFMMLAVILWSLFAVALIYLTFRHSQQKMKDIKHLETQSLLTLQEDANQTLARINSTLEISEERLAVTLNSIGDAVIATDDNGFVTMLNPLGEKLTGWTKVEALGLHVSNIFHIINQETRLPSVIPVLKTLAKGSIQGMANHTILISRDGTERSIADSCAPICERSGELVGTIMVFRDVTAEYATQRALADSASIIASTLNTVADSIITFNAMDGNIRTLNHAAKIMFGFEDEELIGKKFSLLIPQLEYDNQDNTLTAYKACEEAITSKHTKEMLGRSKDQETFPVEIAVNEMWLGGVRYLTCILRDITVRKQLEIGQAKMDKLLLDKNAELEQATFMAEKANLAKSDFLSQMSHELRTPLSAILGFAQLIESSTPAPSSSQKKSVDQILKAGWFLLDLINEILDLALIESGKIAISLEPVSLAEVMRECRAMIEPQAESRQISIRFNEFEAPYFVKADHTRVKQILINLLSNAIKYNVAGGTVDISYSLTDANLIRINIADTGSGLSQELIEQLFQPFNRLGQNAKAEVGTGIGLVVCKRLVELMDGKIGVDSTVGKGSLFWIELNLIIDLHSEQYEHDYPNLLAKSKVNAEKSLFKTVLHVEDNPAILMFVEDMISRRSDIHLHTATHGHQGIKMAQSLQPDLILMDIHLPGINGLDALKILKKDKKTAHIPIIALSANAVPHDIERGLKAGFYRYLTKPIRVNELMEAIDEALKLTNNTKVSATKEEVA